MEAHSHETRLHKHNAMQQYKGKALNQEADPLARYFQDIRALDMNQLGTQHDFTSHDTKLRHSHARPCLHDLWWADAESVINSTRSLYMC